MLTTYRRGDRQYTYKVTPKQVVDLAGYAVKGAKYAYKTYTEYEPFAKTKSKQKKVNRQIRSFKRPAKVYKSVHGLKNQVKELKRIAESNMGTLLYRQRETARVLSGVNGLGQNSFDGSQSTFLELVLAQLRYYDHEAPSALTTASGITGTYQKEFYFSRNYAKIMVRNNYQVPCKVTLYAVTPKGDTSLAPQTAFTQGLSDVGNPTATSPLVYLTDSELFNDLWRIEKSKDFYIMPGTEASLSHSTKSFQYDPSMFDDHNLLYQKKFGSFAFIVRLTGVLAHDTVVTTEQTTIQAGVDVQIDSTWVVKYAAGVDIKFVFIDNNADATFTNAGITSASPIVDNQSFSLA